MDQSHATVGDPLDGILARYLDEARAVSRDAGRLKALREAYIFRHPEVASELARHFQGEDALGESLGALAVLPQLERYADVTCIGQGNMGVVYKAFDRRLKRWVALKVPPLDLSTLRDAGILRGEAESLARLTHRNIVRVFDVADYEGRPVITMELMRGGSLEEQLDRFRGDPRALATLGVAVARAVHYAHQRGILHRDLKPSNVLLDADDRGSDHPYVSDFGLAKLMTADESECGEEREPGPGTTRSGAIVGTPSYMSPEQASGTGATTLSDVYGLGGILYALLTGRPPFSGESAQDTLAQVRDHVRRPQAPHSINARADRTLEAISMRCLEKDPAGRYRSAEGVAKDLDRWLAHRPTDARPLGPLGRTGLWCRRNPVGTGLVIALAALTTLAGVDITSRLEEPRRIRRTVAGQTAALLQTRLEDMKQAVESTARHPRLGEVLARGDQSDLQLLIESEGSRHQDLDGTSPFDTLLIVDGRDGAFVARWPAMDAGSVGLDFRGRDYYNGLASLTVPGAYVSRAFRAVTDQRFKFGVSAWVTHEGNRVGIVAATVTTDARMGLAGLENESFVTSVLALRDSYLMPGETGTPPPGASPYVILLHPAYQRGIEPKWFPRDHLTSLPRGDIDDYTDSAASLDGQAADRYGGAWAASLAPVSNSHFIVMVQQRRSAAPIDPRILGVLAVMALLVAAALAYARLGRRQT